MNIKRDKKVITRDNRNIKEVPNLIKTIEKIEVTFKQNTLYSWILYKKWTKLKIEKTNLSKIKNFII